MRSESKLLVRKIALCLQLRECKEGPCGDSRATESTPGETVRHRGSEWRVEMQRGGEVLGVWEATATGVVVICSCMWTGTRRRVSGSGVHIGVVPLMSCTYLQGTSLAAGLTESLFAQH